jgi:hypothetical protein
MKNQIENYLDLDNPIFVVYLNVDGITRACAICDRPKK